MWWNRGWDAERRGGWRDRRRAGRQGASAAPAWTGGFKRRWEHGSANVDRWDPPQTTRLVRLVGGAQRCASMNRWADRKQHDWLPQWPPNFPNRKKPGPKTWFSFPISFVRLGRLELPRPHGHWNLNPARLPIPPQALVLSTLPFFSPETQIPYWRVLFPWERGILYICEFRQ